MKRLLCIIKHDFKITAVNKAFVIMTILGPFMLAAIAILPGLLASRPPEIQANTRVAVIGGDALLYQQLAAAFTDSNIVLEFGGERDAHLNRIGTNELQGLLVIPTDQGRSWVDAVTLNYFSKTATDIVVYQTLGSVIGNLAVAARMAEAGLDPVQVRDLSRTPQLRAARLDDVRRDDPSREDGDGKSNDDGSTGSDIFMETFFTAMAFVMMIYMTVLLYGQMIGRAVLTEKTSKTVEVMLSSVSPIELMFGKILGHGLAGLLQYAVWIGLAGLFIGVIGPLVNVSVPATLSVGNLGMLLVFFLLAFFLYSAAYGALGAGAEDEQHFGQLSVPILIFLVLPLVMVSYFVMNPNATATVVLSMVPMTAPIVMLLRVLVSNPPLWQVLVSIALMIGLIGLVAWVGARIFRVGLLMTGKRFSFIEVLKLARVK